MIFTPFARRRPHVEEYFFKEYGSLFPNDYVKFCPTISVPAGDQAVLSSVLHEIGHAIVFKIDNKEKKLLDFSVFNDQPVFAKPYGTSAAMHEAKAIAWSFLLYLYCVQNGIIKKDLIDYDFVLSRVGSFCKMIETGSFWKRTKEKNVYYIECRNIIKDHKPNDAYLNWLLVCNFLEKAN